MESNFVDVWHGCLLQPYQDIDSLLSIMSEQEKQKANTFKLDAMRTRYIAVRTTLRQVLASYLGSDPVKLEFKAAEHGKPFLVCESLHFNLSHTANQLVIAVANFPHIGIDIEEIKSRSNFESLAARSLSVNELKAWRHLTEDAQRQSFYRLWTKKEAFMKAVGRGLAMGLQQCEVELASGGQLKTIPQEYGAATDWLTTELAIDASVHAALVTPRSQYELTMRQLYSEANF
ncbi:MAG: 4-phosphopantetheinyl transferase [Methylomonas sp.]|nr:MAG: 4-phosphopantetheinyl transferase [Methylomonas sp.]